MAVLGLQTRAGAIVSLIKLRLSKCTAIFFRLISADLFLIGLQYLSQFQRDLGQFRFRLWLVVFLIELDAITFRPTLTRFNMHRL